MVSALSKFCPTSQDKVLQLQGRYYGATSPKPVMKKVPTQCNNNGRSPRLDLIMSQHALQPRTHDAIITVKYKGENFRFHIFVKKHQWLRKNNVVRILKARTWQGDIVVMKKGRSELVSMPSNMAHLADYAVKRFVAQASQEGRFEIRGSLTFHKRR